MPISLPAVYPILDTQSLARRGIDIVDGAEALLAGGAQILQFRHKGHYSRQMFETASAVAERCRQARALFLVNDRADITLLLDAGLHVGQDDLPPAEARRLLGPSRVLGFSTHNATQLAAANAEPVDYLAIGPIFGTVSKENPDPVVGVCELRRLRLMTARPLVAIGGITRATAAEVWSAGADSIAVIGDVIPESGGAGALRDRMSEWRAAQTSGITG